MMRMFSLEVEAAPDWRRFVIEPNQEASAATAVLPPDIASAAFGLAAAALHPGEVSFRGMPMAPDLVVDHPEAQVLDLMREMGVPMEIDSQSDCCLDARISGLPSLPFARESGSGAESGAPGAALGSAQAVPCAGVRSAAEPWVAGEPPPDRSLRPARSPPAGARGWTRGEPRAPMILIVRKTATQATLAASGRRTTASPVSVAAPTASDDEGGPGGGSDDGGGSDESSGGEDSDSGSDD